MEARKESGERWQPPHHATLSTAPVLANWVIKKVNQSYEALKLKVFVYSAGIFILPIARSKLNLHIAFVIPFWLPFHLWLNLCVECTHLIRRFIRYSSLILSAYFIGIVSVGILTICRMPILSRNRQKVNTLGISFNKLPSSSVAFFILLPL